MIHLFLDFVSQPWCVLVSMERVCPAIEVNTFFQVFHILFGSSSFSMLIEFNV